MQQYNSQKNGQEAARRYMQALKFIVMISMLGVMYVSAGFSEDGFSFNLAGYEWIGWFLALVTIVVQLAWNRMEDKTLTTWLIGVATYLYSIGTNIIGVHAAQTGGSGESGQWIFPVILGIFLDVLPEPLFVWALTNGVLGSDPIGAALDGVGMTKSRHEPARQKNRGNQNFPIDPEVFSQLPKQGKKNKNSGNRQQYKSKQR